MRGYRGAAPVTVAPVVSEPALAPASVPVLAPEPVPPIFSALDGRIAQDYRSLEAWWSFFSDPVLNGLISSGLNMNAAQLSQMNDFPEDKMTKEALVVYYKDKRVALVSAIAKDYVEYRYFQVQNNLLEEYKKRQEMALEEAVDMKERQITTELEYLNQKKREYTKELQKVSLLLSKSTRLLPEYIDEILKDNQKIPDYDITPILASSALNIINSSRIDTARTRLFYITRGQISVRETKDMLPNIRFNQLFGISENIFVNPQSSWRVKIGYARKQVNFSSLLLHLSHRQHTQDFESDVNAYVMEIEGLLVSIATLHDQEEVLEKAVAKVEQKDVYKARLAALRAEYEKTKAIVRLFEKLDLY